MKNKRGFTLIELLAVIVVLAIIALITIPQVLGMTDKARGSANLRSVEGHIENVNNSLAFNAFENKTVNGIHSFTDFDFTNYPKKDHIRCETYVVVKNVVKDAINCNINNVDYCYSNGKGITCEEYNSDENKKLAKMILNDNSIVQDTPSIHNSSSDAGDTSGLYSLTNTNGTTYYFRGNVTNNYVKFKNKLWQIVRINEDGTTRLILNDSINSSGYVFTSTNSGLENSYYSNSTLKTEVDNWYNTNIGNDSKVATGNYFCEAIKVKSSYNVGNASVLKYSAYVPDYLCPTDGNGHGYINSSVGLITYDEAVYAGAYINHNNTDFYLYRGILAWTMSNMGVDDSDKAYEWRLSENGTLAGTSLGNRRHAFPVINIKKDVTAIKQYDSALGADVYVID